MEIKFTGRNPKDALFWLENVLLPFIKGMRDNSSNILEAELPILECSLAVEE